MISREPYRHRWMMLGLIVWVSVCLIAAGWSSAEIYPNLKKMWVLAGLTGLVSAIGLSEVLKSEVQAQQQHLTALLAEARTDILTGLGNRRSFDEELDRWWAQWKRQGTLLSILLIDVDQFKELNDSYGHQAGDHVLKGIARILVNSTRAVDHVARYGGDEFAVLLLGTNLSGARVPAERLRAGIANYKFAFGEAELQATVTVGLAEVTPADEQPAALIRRADASLYAAKEAGRNCCYFHNGLTSEPVETAPAESVDTPREPSLDRALATCQSGSANLL